MSQQTYESCELNKSYESGMTDSYVGVSDSKPEVFRWGAGEMENTKKYLCKRLFQACQPLHIWHRSQSYSFSD